MNIIKIMGLSNTEKTLLFNEIFTQLYNKYINTNEIKQRYIEELREAILSGNIEANIEDLQVRVGIEFNGISHFSYNDMPENDRNMIEQRFDEFRSPTYRDDPEAKIARVIANSIPLNGNNGAWIINRINEFISLLNDINNEEPKIFKKQPAVEMNIFFLASTQNTNENNQAALYFKKSLSSILYSFNYFGFWEKPDLEEIERHNTFPFKRIKLNYLKHLINSRAAFNKYCIKGIREQVFNLFIYVYSNEELKKAITNEMPIYISSQKYRENDIDFLIKNNITFSTNNIAKSRENRIAINFAPLNINVIGQNKSDDDKEIIIKQQIQNYELNVGVLWNATNLSQPTMIATTIDTKAFTPTINFLLSNVIKHLKDKYISSTPATFNIIFSPYEDDFGITIFGHHGDFLVPLLYMDKKTNTIFLNKFYFDFKNIGELAETITTEDSDLNFSIMTVLRTIIEEKAFKKALLNTSQIPQQHLKLYNMLELSVYEDLEALSMSKNQLEEYQRRIEKKLKSYNKIYIDIELKKALIFNSKEGIFNNIKKAKKLPFVEDIKIKDNMVVFQFIPSFSVAPSVYLRNRKLFDKTFIYNGKAQLQYKLLEAQPALYVSTDTPAKHIIIAFDGLIGKVDNDDNVYHIHARTSIDSSPSVCCLGTGEAQQDLMRAIATFDFYKVAIMFWLWLQTVNDGMGYSQLYPFFLDRVARGFPVFTEEHKQIKIKDVMYALVREGFIQNSEIKTKLKENEQEIRFEKIEHKYPESKLKEIKEYKPIKGLHY